ncbi:MAG: hypothetical protein E7773_14435 [Sphingomonas sp.]|uniref:hypothetical protein n=1 Tax=Sphingomonas sp. TaxID=28214 RepID=UPI0012075EFB|nr:hypothetical protein [Sphingomonas sp.]THD34850.1 MAG: hypothetical protein E7773_14435 [Sphingomonas sp.]
MGEEEVALPPRWPQIVLAVILVAVFLAAQGLSDRPQLPLYRPWVDHVADLPATADRDRYTDYVYEGTASFPTGRRLTLTRLADRAKPSSVGDWYRNNPTRLGYSIKEFVVLSMPFFATKDYGYTLYVDGDSTMFFYPLDDDMLHKLREEVKAPVGEGFTFRWWNHMWGWIPLLALVGIVVLEVRRAVIKRRQSGIL